MIPFNEIDDRLEKLGKNRAWLVEATGRSEGAIRSALAPNASGKHRSELLQRVLSKAIEEEESAQKDTIRLPDQLALAPTPEEFNAWCRAYKASSAETLKEWAIDELNKAAEAWAKQQQKSPRIFPAPAANVVELPFYGTVAAGAPAAVSELPDETHPVPGSYDPATHYVLRVNGQSMEPNYPDGSHIICRKLRDGEFAKKGNDVIATDASGATFKRLAYVKDGPKGNGPRKAVPRLVSINPEFPDVVPITDCPIVAVVVGKA